MRASRARSTPASASSTRIAASDTAISAGCAFSVSVSVSAGPSQMTAGELLAERRVDLVEHRARRREGVGKRLAHADRLAALAWKHESDRHALSLAENRALRHRAIRAVKPSCSPALADAVSAACLLVESPYNPRFRSIPAGS